MRRRKWEIEGGGNFSGVNRWKSSLSCFTLLLVLFFCKRRSLVTRRRKATRGIFLNWRYFSSVLHTLLRLTYTLQEDASIQSEACVEGRKRYQRSPLMPHDLMNSALKLRTNTDVRKSTSELSTMPPPCWERFHSLCVTVSARMWSFECVWHDVCNLMCLTCAWCARMIVCVYYIERERESDNLYARVCVFSAFMLVASLPAPLPSSLPIQFICSMFTVSMHAKSSVCKCVYMWVCLSASTSVLVLPYSCVLCVCMCVHLWVRALKPSDIPVLLYPVAHICSLLLYWLV